MSYFINTACYDELTDMSSALVIESFCEHCDLYWSFHSYIIITVLNHGKCYVVYRYLYSHYSHNISASDIHSYLKNFRHKHEPCYFFFLF